MILRTLAFTERAHNLENRIESLLSHDIVEKCEEGEASKRAQWIEESFSLQIPLIFIGACGIAVREVSPFVKDKLSDSPVLVIDEHGRYVIPILSGHVGGANELAEDLAGKLGAAAVITTATDLNGLFSVDVFARKNALSISSSAGIKKVSAKLLNTGSITMAIDPGIRYESSEIPPEIELVPFDNAEKTDVLITFNSPDKRETEASADLILIPKTLILGIGCKKGISAVEIEALAEKCMKKLGINEEIAAVSTIDLKEREYGLNLFAQQRGLLMKTYSAEELEKIEGEFEESEFVSRVTGVGNVCERAALAAAGEQGELLLHKTAEDGVTVAISRREVCLGGWKK